MADKVGAFNRLGYDDDTTTATVEFEFLEGSQIGLTQQHVNTNGMRGTRSQYNDRNREGTRRVDGNLLFAPTPGELATLLPLILGGSPSGTTYPLAETVPAHYWIAVRDGTTYSYNGCCVEQATFSAQEGGALQLAMTVVGKDEAQSGSIGSNTIDATTGGPLTFMEGAVTVGGSSYEFSSFELSIRNVLEVKYRNSLTPTQIKATDRVVTVSLPFSLGDASALYGSATTGVAVVATFTNGGGVATSLTFSLTKVATPKNPLPFGQRGILDLPWQGRALRTSSTAELVVTLDSSP